MSNAGFKQAIWYLLPALVVMAVFTYYPLGNAIVQSFNRNRSPDNYELSLKTYEYLINDRDFKVALRNTFLYTAVVTPVSIAISILIASMLVSIQRLRTFFQTIFFIPYVTSAVAVAFTWAFLFNTDRGLVNLFLGNLFHLPKIRWLTDPNVANYTVIIFGIWRSLAFNILILTTGMLSVDPQYYKAAQVDGASATTAFVRITLPLISPVIAYLFTIGMINAFKVFNEVYTLIGNLSRSVSAHTLVVYIFDAVWRARDYSLASAASVVLLLVVLVLTAFSRWVSSKTNFYG
ncbi:MAG: sugar ABC transporter permease [Symbiobacteriaceae bacterium]|nr:sugar ABC transporter permease [Symbiobacteriaceae bacterium]